MVCENCSAGEKGDRGGGIGRDQDHAGQLPADSSELDVQHPRLDDLTPALVGTPDSSVALRRLRGSDRVPRSSGEMYAMRRREAGAGYRCARYLVFVGTAAV